MLSLFIPLIFEISSLEYDVTPTPILLFDLFRIDTVSPLSNLPLTSMIPTESKLFSLLNAFSAPSSTIIDPLFFMLLSIHFFLALNLFVFGINTVQDLFFSNLLIGLFSDPLVKIILQPEAIHIFAASILVIIPPEP